MRASALVVVSALLFAAGCGGSRQNQDAAIDAALAKSPRSYLHYTAPVWWGKRPNIHRDSLTVDGQFALARISAQASHRGEREQWVLLAHGEKGWRVVGDVLGKAASLPCTDATKQSLEHLAGGCSRGPAVWPGGAIVGPSAERAPTSSESDALTAAAGRVVFSGHDNCVAYIIGVSKVDRRYARVAYQFHKPYGSCHIGNGESLFKRTPSGWIHLGDASDPFLCASVPAGVARSLFGECWLPAR